MPIGYEYDAETQLVHTKVGSELSLTELVDYLRALNNDDRIASNAVEIVLLQDIRDFSVRAADIQEIESELRENVVESGALGTIFVGDEPLQVGVANMLSGMLTALFPDYPAPVVRNMEEALEQVEAIRGKLRGHEVGL